MRVEIVTIGDELLVGQTIDTNSAFMAKMLNDIGLDVYQITSISDTSAHIVEALDTARKRADVVLMTGGLGPTKDDITKHTLCEYFDTKLEIHEETLAKITELFRSIGREMLEVNVQQAALPVACTALENRRGTAQGMWFEEDDTIFVSMPGVPFEMEGLMKNQVIPRLKDRFDTREIVHLSIMTQGIGESYLAEQIGEWADSLDDLGIKLAYLPSAGSVKLRLSKYGEQGDQDLAKELQKKADEVFQLVPNYAYGLNEISLPEVLGELLSSRNETLSTAESCTGGSIASRITEVAGSSAYFLGAIVSYANEIKIGQLGVDSKDLVQHGAVSQQVVEQMALGAQKKLNTTWSIATSGIAGPSGGSEEKPVGTVWMAIAGPGGVKSKKFNFAGDRYGITIRSTLSALNFLRIEILKSAFAE